MSDPLHLADHLDRPPVQARLQAFAEELTMQSCSRDARDASAAYLAHVEDAITEAVEGTVRGLSVESFDEWPADPFALPL